MPTTKPDTQITISKARSGAQWIDILKPTQKDLDWLQKKFHIHPVIIEELKEPSARSRVDVNDSYLYLIYYYPVYDPAEETSRRTEIDFVITKDSVITVHYEKLEALASFDEKADENSFRLAYRVIEALLNFQERQLRHIGEKIEAIGGELFHDGEKDVLKKISRLKRDVSEYRIIVRHQGVILRSLRDHGIKFWGKEAEVYLSDLMGDHLKVADQLESYREAIADFEDTNNQLMSLKINEVMKTFTTLSFLTFPFMLLAAIFGMNAANAPLVNFWVILAIMGFAMVVLLAYFKKKNWL